jgi:hypothetical protein
MIIAGVNPVLPCAGATLAMANPAKRTLSGQGWSQLENEQESQPGMWHTVEHTINKHTHQTYLVFHASTKSDCPCGLGI